ncbi:MAG: nitroreductase family protein [Candidatus Omnitrophica bacterium]|nr:nitroreductase family protein [Candidatus Omnitrophota bacterium]
MNFMELAGSRRSVRDFSARKIARKDLDASVDAARLSPSACNSQPWRFVIIDDDGILEIISKEAFSGLHKMNSFVRSAPALIAIISESKKIVPKLGEFFQRTDYRLIDTGIACQQIVLAAGSLGIGSCILGWFNEKELKKALCVPREKKIELVIALGYPRTNEFMERRLKDRTSTVSYNGYI